MADGTPTPAVRLELGNRTVSLRFTTKGIIRLEDVTGQDFGIIYARLNHTSLTAISRLVWAAQLHEDDPLSFDEVVDRIPLDKLRDVGDAVGRAFMISQGFDPDELEGMTPEEIEQFIEDRQSGEAVAPAND